VLSDNPIQYVKPLRKKDDAETYEGALDLSDRLDEDEYAQLLRMHSKVDLPLFGGQRDVDRIVSRRACRVTLERN